MGAVDLLATVKPLPRRYVDHPLTGESPGSKGLPYQTSCWSIGCLMRTRLARFLRRSQTKFIRSHLHYVFTRMRCARDAKKLTQEHVKRKSEPQ